MPLVTISDVADKAFDYIVIGAGVSLFIIADLNGIWILMLPSLARWFGGGCPPE